MKKLATITLAVILALTMMLSLAACGDGSDDSAQKDTPAPAPEATPTPTPEPTPTPCAHVWVDADCENPETCSVCGETQGAPLGHDFTEANYQEASVCLVCGADGDGILTPGAEQYSLNLITEIGVAQPYSTMTGENALPVSGEVTLDSVERHDEYAGYEAKEGNEFIVANATIKVWGQEARDHGFYYLDTVMDYYTYDPSLGVKFKLDSTGYPSVLIIGNINYYGEETEFEFLSGGSLNWSGPRSNRVATLELIYKIEVPIGYDGVILAFASSRFIALADPETAGEAVAAFNGATASDIFDPGTVFFHLKG